MSYNGYTNRETWLFSVVFAGVINNLELDEMTGENVYDIISELPVLKNSPHDLIIHSVDISLVDFDDLAEKFRITKELAA
jgi:hypothetical protein